MRKNNIDFLSKFGERVEKIGKDGVMGIMKKHTGPSINNNNIIYNEIFNRDFNKNLTYKPNRNNFEQNNTYINNNKFTSNSSNILNIYPMLSNNINNRINPINHFEEMNRNRKSISSNNDYRNNNNPLIYSCQINRKNNPFENENNIYYNSKNKNRIKNKYEIGDNRQKILDFGYKPYTIKDYKKINNDINMGKLGANLGTKEWNEKKERMTKMSNYGKQIIIKGKENQFKKNEIYEDKQNNFDEIKNNDEKWNNINEYSDGNNYKLNNEFKKNINDKSKYNSYFDNNNVEYGHSIDKILKNHVNINYRRRLNNLKNILY